MNMPDRILEMSDYYPEKTLRFMDYAQKWNQDCLWFVKIATNLFGLAISRTTHSIIM